MAGKSDLTPTEGGKFEFRVWGKHPKARRKVLRLATHETSEEFDDCYLLGDDQNWNAKVRDDTLKVKELVDERRGFGRWTSQWHTEAETAPSPYDSVFEDLSLDRAQRGQKYNLNKAVSKLPDDGPQALFVTKRRDRYRIGEIRAEITEIEVHDSSTVLQTLAIEGSDLDELARVRRKLGLKGHDNVPMHVALDAVCEAS